MNLLKSKDYILLHFILLIYSLSGLFSKLASSKKFLSFEFIFFYGLTLLILFIYAVLWQHILKKMTLIAAFGNKAVTIIWGMIWGSLFFGEKITIYMIIGTVIILLGILLMVSKNE
jgi:drug/metabolite transporter (DMT)-like permease